MWWEIKVGGIGGPSDDFILSNKKKENENSVVDRIREENIKAEIEREMKKKEEQELMKKSMMSEDDLKILLLMFGSRGSTTLLEKVIEKKKREQQLD